MAITNEQYVEAIGRAGLTLADGVLNVARKDVSGCSPDWSKYVCWLKEIKSAQYFLSLEDYTSEDAIYFYNAMLRIAEMSHISPSLDPTAQPVGGIVITPTGSGIYVDLISNQNNINGFKGFLKPVTVPDGTAPTHAVNLSQLNAKAPVGLLNQQQYVTEYDSNDYYTDDQVKFGQFITNDDELASALTRGGEAQKAIFDTWKRFSHGNVGFLTDNIPSIPLETNSWAYDEGTNTINSTLNTNSGIGFFSPDKYDSYSQLVTLKSTDADNDWIGVVIAALEDPDDLVTNQALGLDPNDFDWPIDVTSATIPNQHTLTVLRNRNNINQQYFIAYDWGKTTQKIVANGTDIVGLYKTTNNWSGVDVDIQIIRNGNIVTTYSSQYSDSGTGKGAPNFMLEVDLASDPDLEKFIGKQSYGYFAMSQLNSQYLDITFSENTNVIYDLRNGDTYVFGAAGYEIDPARSFFTEVGVRRLLFNPYESTLLYVSPDGTINIISYPYTDLTTSSNGLTKTLLNTVLGGTLDNDTIILLNGKQFSLGQFGTSKTKFYINSAAVAAHVTGELDQYTDISVQSNNITLQTAGINGANSITLILANEYNPSSTSGAILDDGFYAVGFIYGGDYYAQGHLNDRWLPDWGSVKALLLDSGFAVLDADNTFTGANTFEDRITAEGGFDLSGGQSSINLAGALSIDATGLQFGSTPLYEASSPVITDPTFVYVTKFNGTSYTISRVPVSFLLAKENTIDAMGDSMTANGFYVNALQGMLPAAHTIINMGISGNQAFNMDARFSAVTNSGSKDTIVFGGVNDISFDRSAAEIQASLQSMYTKASNAGKQVIAFTIPPFGTNAIYTVGREAVRVAVNTWIASTAINVDEVIDVSTLLQDPLNNLNLNPLYDSGDGLHFNSAGGVVIANNVIANVTFTTDLTNTNLKISNNVSLQQGLGVFDTPTFRGINGQTIILVGTQTTGNPTATIVAGAINNIALLIQTALATQTSDLIQVQNAAGTPYFQVGPGIAGASSVQTISPQGTTVVGMTIQAPAAYATDGFRFLDSSSNTLVKMNGLGFISVASGIGNATSATNAQILLTTTGIQASHNVADANVAFDIQNTQLAATGAILRLRQSSTTIASFTVTGLGIGIAAPTGSLQVTKPTNGIGTISTTATGTTVTGVNTDFLNRFRVGQTITANGETRTISAIASNTSMTTDAWTNTNTNIAYTGVSANALLVNMNGVITATGQINLNGSVNGTTDLNVVNSNAGASADSRIVASNGTNSVGFIQRGTAFTSNPGVSYINVSGTNKLGVLMNGTERYTFASAGNLGIRTTSPTAALHLPAGTATVNTAPVKYTSGTNLTTPEAGAIEFNGTNWFGTPSTVRKTFSFVEDLPNSVPSILSATTVNAVVLGSTALYTVPAGKTLTVTGVYVRCTVATAITVTAQADVGVSAGDVYSNSSTALTTTGRTFQYNLGGTSRNPIAGEVVNFNINTAATGTAQTYIVTLVGFLQ